MYLHIFVEKIPPFSVLRQGFILSLGWPGTYVAQADLQLFVILLP